jgi:uncharacterized RmlC-like cupin family protein
VTVPPSTTTNSLASDTPPDAAGKRVVVRSPYESEGVVGAQGQYLIPTITQDMCGATGLSACTILMPPGSTSQAHLHQDTEIIVVCIEGFAATLIGPELEPVFHGPGEFIFIPEGVLHVAVNLSNTERAVGMEVRTDPQLDVDVVCTPEYETRAEEIAAQLRSRYASGDLETPPHWNPDLRGPFALESDRLLNAPRG